MMKFEQVIKAEVFIVKWIDRRVKLIIDMLLVVEDSVNESSYALCLESSFIIEFFISYLSNTF